MPVFTRTNLIEFVEKLFGQGQEDGRGENIQVLCPFCKQKKGEGYNKKKLSIRLDTMVNRCWVCSYSSANLLHIIKKFHPSQIQFYISTFLSSDNLSNPDDEDEHAEEVLKLPEDFCLLAENREAYSHISYLRKRGLSSIRDLWYWKFGISNQPDFKNRIIVPSFDANGELNYFTARSIKPWIKPKYFNPFIHRKAIVFNELNVDWNRELIIVEGPFDAMKCPDNVTALLGSELNEEYKLFHNILYHETPIVLALDPEAQSKSLEIAALLMEYDIPVRFITLKRGKDVGDLSKEEFQSYLSKASKFVSNEDVLREKIRSISL